MSEIILQDSFFSHECDYSKLPLNIILDKITANPWTYIDLPLELRNNPLVQEHAVKTAPFLISRMEYSIDDPLCYVAINKDPMALRFIHYNHRSENLVKKAISANYRAVIHATYNLKQEESFVKWCLNVSPNTALILQRANPSSTLIKTAVLWQKCKNAK